MIVIVIAIVIVVKRAMMAASDWADINKAQRAAAEGKDRVRENEGAVVCMAREGRGRPSRR